MIALRRWAGAVAVGTVILAFASPPAAEAAPATTPEVFVGSATAQGLDLSLNGQTVTIGSGLAKVTSQLLTAANGTAIMSVLGSTTSTAQLSGASNGNVNDGPHCNPVIPLTVLQINNACTTSTSTMAGGLAHAVSRNTVDGIDLTLNSVLSSLPLGQTLTQTLQPIVNQLPVPTQLDPVKSTLGGVLSDVLKTPTAHLTVGDSVSDVATSAGQVVSTGVARGGQLDILPAPAALNGAVQPLASVIIGSSKATATYDRVTGKSTSAFDPALVTVKLAATPLTPAVTVPVSLGQTQTIALPAGLGSITIQVAGGNTFTNPDGSVGALANAVKLGIKLLDQPLVNLAVAGAQATVAGAPAVTAAAPVASPLAPAPTLPHTGGSPWIALVGGALLAGFLVSRRVLAGAR